MTGPELAGKRWKVIGYSFIAANDFTLCYFQFTRTKSDGRHSKWMLPRTDAAQDGCYPRRTADILTALWGGLMDSEDCGLQSSIDLNYIQLVRTNLLHVNVPIPELQTNGPYANQDIMSKGNNSFYAQYHWYFRMNKRQD